MKATGLTSLLCAFIALPIAAHAQSVTYDFSGTINDVSGIYAAIPLGATVTGTYTFELSNASPSQSSGTVGSPTSPWTAQLFGGSFYLGAPTPVSSVVFSSTASVDGFTYASFGPSPFLTNTRVLTFGPPASSAYEADELICESSATCHSSNLFGNDMFGINYTSAGLPDFSASPDGWFGQLATGEMFGSDYLRFQVTSLAPVSVSEPTPLVLMGIGLSALGWAARRRSYAPSHRDAH